MVAMTNLCYTGRTFVSFGAMLLFIIGWGLIAVAYVAKRHIPRLAGYAPGAAKTGGAVILFACLAVLFYISIPLVLNALIGVDVYGIGTGEWCKRAPQVYQPCACPESQKNCACIIG